MTLVERLRDRADDEQGPYAGPEVARWWLNAIAEELEAVGPSCCMGGERCAGQDAAHWLRSQAEPSEEARKNG